MDKNYFIALTINLYQATDVFPDEEPLKFLLRKRADQLLEELTPHHFSVNLTLERRKADEIEKKIQSLQSLLKVAESREESDSLTIFLLSEEYERIKEEIEGPCFSKGSEKKERKVENNPLIEKIEEKEDLSLNERQERILNLLRQESHLQAREIAQKFSGVTSRTIRRDLEILVNQGRLERRKEGSRVLYQPFPVDKY
jgi:DNA-binding transcriptional ArsR family regulator